MDVFKRATKGEFGLKRMTIAFYRVRDEICVCLYLKALRKFISALNT